MLKKSILPIFLSIFGLSALQAQEVSFGAKAGYENMSEKLSDGNGHSDSYSSSGIYFGGLADFSVSTQFHIRPELLFSRIFFEGGGGLSTLELPVLAQYNIANTGAMVVAGPQFGYILNNDSDGDLKSFLLNFNVGAGYNFTENIFAEARYNLGLNNLMNYEGGDFNKYKINYFQIGVGYRF